jgi:uncharacterized protein (DUF488 family)
MTEAITLWTIGHSSRSLEEFLALLAEAEIRCLVDVRAYPASRRHPHFARASLEKSLAQAGVRYVWEGRALGGRRTPVADSPHVALKDLQFRAYADHMMTAVFREGLARLVTSGRDARTAIMCAERLPSECHRSLVSDALVARGVAVSHIVHAGGAEPHALSAGARRTQDGIVYDAGAQLPLLS